MRKRIYNGEKERKKTKNSKKHLIKNKNKIKQYKYESPFENWVLLKQLCCKKPATLFL